MCQQKSLCRKCVQVLLFEVMEWKSVTEDYFSDGSKLSFHVVSEARMVKNVFLFVYSRFEILRIFLWSINRGQSINK